MRNIVKRIMGRGSEDQKGFTLIELLIVVGIIVALAAVIIPLVIQFSGKGQEGARATEAVGVQTAIDVMMSDAILATLTIGGGSITAPIYMDTTGHAGATLTDLDGGVGAETLTTYLREQHTEWCYEWDATGSITSQSTDPLDESVTPHVCP